MSTTKIPVTALAVGLALSAAAICAPACAAPRTDRSVAAAHLTLTNADNGHSVTVRSGEVITVRLSGHRSAEATWQWSAPSSSESRILRRVAGGTSPSGNASAVFRPEADGNATISANERCVSAPGHICPHTVLHWTATVHVK